MKPDLSIACNKFQIACMQKIEKKEKEGYTKWNDPNFKSNLVYKLWTHCVSYVGKDRNEKKINKSDKEILIDIANFCNFLWNLEDKVMKSKKHGGYVIQISFEGKNVKDYRPDA
ncbi:unnamed protein product, partial [marine sediment metagenome]